MASTASFARAAVVAAAVVVSARRLSVRATSGVSAAAAEGADCGSLMLRMAGGRVTAAEGMTAGETAAVVAADVAAATVDWACVWRAAFCTVCCTVCLVTAAFAFPTGFAAAACCVVTVLRAVIGAEWLAAAAVDCFALAVADGADD